MNRLTVVTAGSTLSNEGTITLRVAGGGATMCVMGPLTGLSHHGIFTVPHGHNFVALSVLTGSNNASISASLQVQTRNNVIANSPFLSRLLLEMWGFQTSPAEFSTGFGGTEKTDIRLRIVTCQADNIALQMTLAGLLLRTADV